MEALIFAIALKNNIDPHLLASICFQESRYVNATIKDGHTKSYGVCQVKRIAAKQVKMNHVDLNDVNKSVDVAAKYLKYNLKRCSNLRESIAAYNVGKCVKNPQRNGYVDKVLKYYYQINLTGSLE